MVIPNNLQAPLIQPVFTLDNSMTTQLGVYLTAVPNAKAYQVQFSTGTGAWQEAGIYPNTKGIVLTNLTRARFTTCASAPLAAPRNTARGARRCPSWRRELNLLKVERRGPDGLNPSNPEIHPPPARNLQCHLRPVGTGTQPGEG